ncbi:hypothetical protein GQ44DRAFT_597986, partial [Phaeosphaeriaceae sp. PMI808]
REDAERELQILEEAAKTDKTGWFKRTGWLEHFKGRNLVHLGHQVRLPDRGEVKLKLAAELTELLIERSVKGLSTLARETRRWLRSAQQNDVDQRPLGRLQNPESQATYASYIVKFVCYYLRIIADEEAQIENFQEQQDEVADSESSDESSREGEDIESEFEGEDGDCGTPPHQRPRRQPQTDMMKDARELFHSFMFSTYGNAVFTSGLIHFLAVLGIDPEMNRLRNARNYSYILAGMVYCVRVLGVEKLLPAAQRDEQSDEDRENFLSMRRRYLADGTYSPMSEMLSLLAYSKYIGMNEGNSGNAYWSEDKKIFYLNGRPIIIARFCKMAQDIQAEATEMLWRLCWITDPADRFTIDLQKVVDDVTFTKRGMSFVDRPENHLSNGLALMLARVESTEGGSRLLLRDGKWNIKAVRRYLLEIDYFLEMGLAGVHIGSGQPARGPEITTIRHRNGVLQDRNLVVASGHVMTIVRYYKSQSQWDNPKVIPRFLPPQLGQVMAVYLVYIQP